MLRRNATRRKKEFTITLEFFREFCYATNYIQKKGRSGDAYTIDRIDNDKGYTSDNIRILSAFDNNSKHHRKLVYDWRTGYAAVVQSDGSFLDNDPKPF